jgi:hypothetical protein
MMRALQRQPRRAPLLVACGSYLLEERFKMVVEYYMPNIILLYAALNFLNSNNIYRRYCQN